MAGGVDHLNIRRGKSEEGRRSIERVEQKESFQLLIFLELIRGPESKKKITQRGGDLLLPESGRNLSDKKRGRKGRKSSRRKGGYIAENKRGISSQNPLLVLLSPDGRRGGYS